MTNAECKCDLRTKTLGDGCEVCNPTLMARLDSAVARSEELREAALAAVNSINGKEAK